MKNTFIKTPAQEKMKFYSFIPVKIVKMKSCVKKGQNVKKKI